MTYELDRRKMCAELRDILATMEVPSFRSQQMTTQNLNWLARNLLINNSEHKRGSEAVVLIRQILKKDSENNLCRGCDYP